GVGSHVVSMSVHWVINHISVRPAPQATRSNQVARCRSPGVHSGAVTPPRNIDPAFATTEDVMNAAGITRQTVNTWVTQGLLPAPTKVSLGSPGGVFNRFPAWAI